MSIFFQAEDGIRDLTVTGVQTCALPILIEITVRSHDRIRGRCSQCQRSAPGYDRLPERRWRRSEEHTSELQSQSNLVCRLLLEKKKINVIDKLVAVLHNDSLSSSI